MQNTDNAVKVLKALADASRLQIVLLLATGPQIVGDIAEKTGINQYNVSKHLKILFEAGLIKKDKQANKRLYEIATGQDEDPILTKLLGLWYGQPCP